MTAAIWDIIIEQGATFEKVITWQDTSGSTPTPVNISNYTARMQIRKSFDSAQPLVSLTTENGGIVLGGALGTITLKIAATATDDLEPNFLGVYDLELIAPTTSKVTRLVQGAVSISPEVTK